VRRNDALDGLRGVAALTVVVFHAWLYTRADVRAVGADGALDRALGEMRVGLVLFFVLSGFLLFRPWVRARLGKAAGGSAADGGEAREPLPDLARGPRLATYAIHRIGRIVPAYYVAIAGSALLLWPLAGEPGVRLPPLEQLPLFLVFAQNQSAQTVMTLDPPMWTLAVEASFYALLPALGWIALRARPTRLGQSIVPLTLLAAGVVFNALLARQALPSMTLSKSLPAMAPYFGLGMLAAVLVHGRTPDRRGALALLAGGAALVLADAWVHSSLVSGSDLALRMRVIRDLPAAVGFAALVAVAATTAPRALAWRPLAWTGVVSYGLYLWHVPMLLVLRANGLLPASTLAATAIDLPLSLLLGWLSFRLIERPAINWSRRTRLLGANREQRVRTPAPRSDASARGRTPSMARASC